jgi:hypothetical protein
MLGMLEEAALCTQGLLLSPSTLRHSFAAASGLTAGVLRDISLVDIQRSIVGK